MDSKSLYRQKMYTFVIYQLSGIQKGIQAGHAWMEYALHYYSTSDFRQWIANDKTVIVLNGGSTNSIDQFGTLQKICKELSELGVRFVTFSEPDLNHAVTAIAFLVDERVWDKETYPRPFYGVSTGNDKWDERKSLEYAVKKTGLPKEVFLIREYLSQFSLANN